MFSVSCPETICILLIAEFLEIIGFSCEQPGWHIDLVTALWSSWKAFAEHKQLSGIVWKLTRLLADLEQASLHLTLLSRLSPQISELYKH